jgi:L-seryl-tRNA(Ser) seleniumtransferase
VLAALELVLRRHLIDAPLPIDGLWPDTQAHLRRLAAVAAPLRAEIVEADGYVGGGAAPDAPIPGHALALPATPGLAERLRQGDPPVVGYVRDGRLILDLRTVLPEDDQALCAAVLMASGGAADDGLR